MSKDFEESTNAKDRRVLILPKDFEESTIRDVDLVRLVAEMELEGKLYKLYAYHMYKFYFWQRLCRS